jgi:hypothetical protein
MDMAALTIPKVMTTGKKVKLKIMAKAPTAATGSVPLICVKEKRNGSF